jgi:hypothetical protein
MRNVAAFRGAITLGLAVVGWVVACSEKFTPIDAPAAGGEPSFAGEGGERPASNGGDGDGNPTSGRGGAHDIADGGNPSAGATGAGGDATTASDSYRAAILADHPLVYWRMGQVSAGAVPDETGSENVLVLQGGGHELGRPGALPGADTAIGFDGVKSFAIATDARALDFVELSAFTLECWARRETGGTSYFQHLLSNVDGVANDRDGYALYLLPEPAQGDAARSVFERDRPAADLGVWGGLGKASVWAHYVAVFDGQSVALYVNGSLANTVAASGNLAARKTPFSVARGAGDANFFKGALDEIAIYPTALEPAAIARHFALSR